MTDSEIESELRYLQDYPDVTSIHVGDAYLYVESSEKVDSESFRNFLSNQLIEEDINYGLEVRSREDSDGYIGIICQEPEHPVQKATIFCGVLDLSDRQTYQTLVKVTDLVDDGLLDEKEYSEFAAACLQVLSTSFKSEPYETSFLCDKFDLDARDIQNYTSRIIRHLEDS